jgi:hypothetical protein
MGIQNGFSISFGNLFRIESQKDIQRHNEKLFKNRRYWHFMRLIVIIPVLSQRCFSIADQCPGILISGPLHSAPLNEG